MTKKTPTTPISIRLTPQERAELVRRAGSRSVSAYVRELVFAARAGAQKPRRSDLAQVLGLLGASDLSSSVGELARLAKLGALPVSEETETALQAACADIAAMKATLMRALGIKER
ncbi:MAG: hypothetical protein ACE360_00525 [Hyphomicrobiales bacterium]